MTSQPERARRLLDSLLESAPTERAESNANPSLTKSISPELQRSIKDFVRLSLQGRLATLHRMDNDEVQMRWQSRGQERSAVLRYQIVASELGKNLVLLDWPAGLLPIALYEGPFALSEFTASVATLNGDLPPSEQSVQSDTQLVYPLSEAPEQPDGDAPDVIKRATLRWPRGEPVEVNVPGQPYEGPFLACVEADWGTNQTREVIHLNRFDAASQTWNGRGQQLRPPHKGTAAVHIRPLTSSELELLSEKSNSRDVSPVQAFLSDQDLRPKWLRLKGNQVTAERVELTPTKNLDGAVIQYVDTQAAVEATQTAQSNQPTRDNPGDLPLTEANAVIALGHTAQHISSLLVEAFLRTKDKLYRIAKSRTRDANEADDRMQDAFLFLMMQTQLPEGRTPEEHCLYTLLDSIRGLLRRQKKMQSLYSDEDSDSAQEIPDRRTSSSQHRYLENLFDRYSHRLRYHEQQFFSLQLKNRKRRVIQKNLKLSAEQYKKFKRKVRLKLETMLALDMLTGVSEDDPNSLSYEYISPKECEIVRLRVLCDYRYPKLETEMKIRTHVRQSLLDSALRKVHFVRALVRLRVEGLIDGYQMQEAFKWLSSNTVVWQSIDLSPEVKARVAQLLHAQLLLLHKSDPQLHETGRTYLKCRVFKEYTPTISMLEVSKLAHPIHIDDVKQRVQEVWNNCDTLIPKEFLNIDL